MSQQNGSSRYGIATPRCRLLSVRGVLRHVGAAVDHGTPAGSIRSCGRARASFLLKSSTMWNG
eukprot:722385-Lingulodinium_polyedra.AAC.1